MILKNPYISILKLKSSIVDLSVVAVTCAVLGTWDYRVAIGIIAGILIHGACDIINDIYDVEIDKICKPKVLSYLMNSMDYILLPAPVQTHIFYPCQPHPTQSHYKPKPHEFPAESWINSCF